MENNNNINNAEDGSAGEPKRRRGRPTKQEQLARKKAELAKKGEALRKSDTLESAINDISIPELEEELHAQHGFGGHNESVNTGQNNDSQQANQNTSNQNFSQATGQSQEDDISEPEYPQEDSSQYTDASEIIPEVNPDPLQDNVIKRGYTNTPSVGGQQTVQTGGDGTHQSSSQNTNTGQSGTNTPPVEDIIPEATTVTNNVPPDPNANTGNNQNNNNNQQSAPKNSFNEKLEDLSPGQKRKAAEKSADALLLAYGQVLPILPKKFSSVSMNKLKTLEIQDKISLNMQIMEDGTTIKEYFEGVNAQVDETFVVTDAMKQEVREPLIEVLLENNVALTPTQRLLMAVGGHVLAMGMATLEFASQNKQALREFKRFHEEVKTQRNESAKAESASKQQSQHTQQTEQRQEENVRTTNANSAPKEEKVTYQETKEEDKVKIDDILENGEGGITIEGEPEE